MFTNTFCAGAFRGVIVISPENRPLSLSGIWTPNHNGCTNPLSIEIGFLKDCPFKSTPPKLKQMNSEAFIDAPLKEVKSVYRTFKSFNACSLANTPI